jgi:hypothetical protein
MLKNSFNVLLIIVLLAVSLSMRPMTGLCEEQSNGGYRLGPEDLVKISILAGGIEQVIKEMVVSETGDINVPFVGKIPAAVNWKKKSLFPWSVIILWIPRSTFRLWNTTVWNFPSPALSKIQGSLNWILPLRSWI